MLGDEIFSKKIEQLEKRQDAMIRYASMTMERQLMKLIQDALTDQLRLDKDGNILSTEENLKILNKIDQVFIKFDSVYGSSMMQRIIEDFDIISQFNYDYFDIIRDVSKQRYDQYAKETDSWLRTSIGLDIKGIPTSSGYLDNLVNDKTLLDEVKHLTYNAVSGQIPLSEFTKGLQTKIEGGKDSDGYLSKYYRTYAYDKYQEYDRANNQIFANKLKLTNFIYTGGLIDDSREFCQDKNNEIFTIEEAKEWKNDATLLKTKAEKETGVLEGYNPIINMGRWRCRHTARFISDAMAKELKK